ncbi:MAG: hypothetical protein JST86_17555 [Bacteroidetes bacterium]|nr:hypothetical protein [Bacteroidota bacterium]
MATGLHQAVMNSYTLQWILDLVYYILPLLLWYMSYDNKRWHYYIAWAMVLFNWMYALLLSSLSMLSVEGFTGWIILPILFAFRTEKGFYYVLHCMRYVFLLLFFSTGVWKIRGGGLFNIEQMGAILIRQHAPYITEAPNNWFTGFVYFMANHKVFAYLFYLAATLLELVFAIGIFTKRYDRLLIILFILFVIMDFFLMRINYFAWTAFLGCLWFSRYAEPPEEKYPLATS